MVKSKTGKLANDEYVVEEVIDKKLDGGKIFYQIKWKGYDNPDDLTWEPIENCINCDAKIKAFESGYKKRRSLSSPKGAKRRSMNDLKPVAEAEPDRKGAEPGSVEQKSRKRRSIATPQSTKRRSNIMNDLKPVVETELELKQGEPGPMEQKSKKRRSMSSPVSTKRPKRRSILESVAEPAEPQATETDVFDPPPQPNPISDEGLDDQPFEELKESIPAPKKLDYKVAQGYCIEAIMGMRKTEDGEIEALIKYVDESYEYVPTFVVADFDPIRLLKFYEARVKLEMTAQKKPKKEASTERYGLQAGRIIESILGIRMVAGSIEFEALVKYLDEDGKKNEEFVPTTMLVDYVPQQLFKFYETRLNVKTHK